MAKAAKSIKSKVTRSYKIDPDLYEEAVRKCMKESLALSKGKLKSIKLSSKVEELIRDWVNGK